MQKNHNNFDFLRLSAALLVWFHHCFMLTGRTDPLLKYIPFETTGKLAVGIFFIISGYLITQSCQKRSIYRFTINRILRVMPALICVVFLTAFVLGPLATTLPLHEYFSSTKTWRYLRSALIFPVQYYLPGVFDGKAINGSLWTLQHEARCYIVIGLMGVLGILNGRVMGCLVLALCGIKLYIAIYSPNSFMFVRPTKLDKALELGILFGFGSLLFLEKARIAMRASWFFAASGLMALAVFMPMGEILFMATLAYITIFIGTRRTPIIRGVGRHGDYSYGVYLYAFPIQQACFYYLREGLDSCIISLLATLLCAYASWHLVEKKLILNRNQ